MPQVVQLPPTLIASSPQIDWLTGEPAEVVHLGQHAALLQLAGRQDLLVCTDRTRGLVPNGLCMTKTAWHRFHAALTAAGHRVMLHTAPNTQVTYHSLRLAPWRDPSALRPTLVATGAGELPPMDLRPLADPTSPHLSATLHGLVGWGAGATPAGDDILVGALAAHLIAGRPDAHRTLATGLLPLLSRTTSASRHDLRAACSGQFCERLHDLLAAAADQDNQRARHLVSDWGASSGHDIVTGLLAGLFTDQDDDPRRPQ